MVDGGSPRILRPGEAVPLQELGGAHASEGDLHVTLAAAGSVPDLVALLIGADGRVRTDDDLVFYNNPVSSDGAVAYEGGTGDGESLRLRCSALDADVARVIVGCAGGVLDQRGTAQLALAITDGHRNQLGVARFPADEAYRGMILLEVYRRADQWRCRLLAQGYSTGLAGLVTDFGVHVEEDSTPPPAVITPPPDGYGVPCASPVTPAQQPAAQPAPSPSPSHPGIPPPSPAWAPHPPLPASPSPEPAGVAPPRSRGLFTSRRRQQLEAQNAELNAFIARSGALDNAAIAAERDRLTSELAALAAEAQRRRNDLADLDHRLQNLRGQIEQAEGEAELQDVGVYRYRHRLDDAVAYKAALERLKDTIRTTAKPGVAVIGSPQWTVDGSIVKGRVMVREVSKLMLRAYNADADHAVRTMRPYKLGSALARLDTTRSTITRLGKTMRIEISENYHGLRRSELELTADYLSKVEQEKDRQRALREQQREDRKVEEEIARKQAQLDKERQRYATALAQLEAGGDTAAAAQVRGQLTSVTAALAGLAQRRENLRLGHVYVISNVGAFGHRMVKIGMTRRLEPEDRIRELGDASVPFRFDKHALILSEDAVELEAWLHRRFRDRAVNRVNTRREFFYVTPAEVRDALAERGEQFLVEFNEVADAAEWHQSDGPDRAVLPT